jgi:hypothetical protein
MAISSSQVWLRLGSIEPDGTLGEGVAFWRNLPVVKRELMAILRRLAPVRADGAQMWQLGRVFLPLAEKMSAEPTDEGFRLGGTCHSPSSWLGALRP